MKITPRIVLGSTIALLVIMMLFWVDELYLKTCAYLGYSYETIKIVFLCIASYKLSKLLINKINFLNKKEESSKRLIFFIIFLILNAYIICQYSYRLVDHRIVKNKIRKEINSKTIKLDFAGWGYQSDSLSYKEFIELTRNSYFPEIPKESETIFVYDWFEIDFHRTLKFNLEKDFDLSNFYNHDTRYLKHIDKMEYDFNPLNHKEIKTDTTKYIRYKWEVHDI